MYESNYYLSFIIIITIYYDNEEYIKRCVGNINNFLYLKIKLN